MLRQPAFFIHSSMFAETKSTLVTHSQHTSNFLRMISLHISITLSFSLEQNRRRIMHVLLKMEKAIGREGKRIQICYRRSILVSDNTVFAFVRYSLHVS